MRDTILILLIAALLLMVVVGCSRQFAPLEPDIEPDKTGDDDTMPQTGWTTAVPSEYFEPSDRPGTVTRLDYESEDYVRDGAAVTKTAYVYTPYGYDAEDTETRYNILYLMHGWGGRAGEYFDYGQNLFDNLIERGDFIYHAVGTQDAVKSQSVNMADEMLQRPTFTPDHYVFYQKDGGYHDFNAVQEYLYNALPLFFKGTD